MSKTDSLAPASKSRRAVIIGAGGIAAAGALATAAQALQSLPTPFSPEFLEYRRRLAWHIYVCDELPEPEFGTPEAEARDAVCAEACEARHQARLVIQNRPVRSRQDFVELAHVVRYELWQQGTAGVWHAHSRCEDLEDVFMRAVFVMIDGGAHV